MEIAQGTTLIDQIFPARVSRTSNLLKDTLIIIGSSLLMVLSARASIALSFTQVPLTLQTLALMLIAATLGSQRAALAMLLYLAEGASGLPVFAYGGGWFYLILSPTAGYLWSYPLAAYVVGLLCERGLDRSFFTAVLAMLAGTLIIYALGVSWLAIIAHMSFYQAFLKGMLIFIPGDLIKVVIAAALLPSAWLFVKSIHTPNK